ncbi:MAG: serine/threonine-protein kinase [bacterium]
MNQNNINPEKTISEKTIVANQPKQPYLTIPELKKWRNYTVVKKIKENNQCCLFLIKDNNKDLILKVFYPFSPFNLETIMKIAEISKKADFPPYLTKIIDYGYSEEFKSYYIVEEYLPEKDLLEYYSQNPLSPEQIKELAKQINEALNYLHKNEIIHLDIKPSNILIRSKNPLIFSITDYNISSYKPKEVDIKLTTFKLTPAYAAPERFTNILTEKSDYWSLGITILEVLIQKNPFENIEPNLILYRILTQGVEIPKSIDPYFHRMLQGLLNTNPEKRWGYQELKDYLEGKQVSVQIPQPEYKIKYKNKEYHSIEELLLSFLKNYEEFRNGVNFIQSPEIDNLLPPQDSKLLKELKQRINDKEIVLNLFISYKFPSLPPYVCSQKLTFDTIMNTIRKVANKEYLNYEDKKIIQLIANFVENKSPNINEIYDFYKDKHSDKDLESFLFNLKKFITPPHIDEQSLYKLCFTIVAVHDKKYYLPSNFVNFKINRDLLNVYLPIVEDLLTIEDYNNLRTTITPENQYFSTFQLLPNLPINQFLPLSENLKKNLNQITKTVSQQRSQKDYWIKILKVLNRYLVRYGIPNSQVEYYLRFPQTLNDQTFNMVYERSIDMIYYRVNYQGRRQPSYTLAIAPVFILVIFSFFVMFISIILCSLMSYPQRYIYGDFLLICFLCGFFSLVASPIIGVILTTVQAIRSSLVRSNTIITREQIKQRIEFEAQYEP